MDEIVAASDIEPASDETLSEYVRRVGDHYDLDEELVENVCEELNVQRFASEKSTTDDHVNEFLDVVSDADAPAKPVDESDPPTDGERSTDSVVEQSGTPASTEPASATSDDRSETSTDSWPVPPLPQSLASTPSRLTGPSIRYARSLVKTPAWRWISEWTFERDRFDLLAGLLIVVSGVLLFKDLGSFPLWNWDEAIYANAARHMVQDGKWIIPHVYWLSWNEANPIVLEPFLEKPPLMLWIQGVFMSIFGVNEVSARAPSTLFALGTAVIVYRFGCVLNSRRLGVVATLVFLTTPYLWTGQNAARLGGTDMAHTFFGTLFVYYTYRIWADGDQRRMYAATITAGLLLLVKGFAAGIFVIVVLPLVMTRPKSFLRRELVVGSIITAGIALPWFAIAYFRYPDQLIQELIVEQVLARAAGERVIVEGASLPFMKYPYFRHFPAFFDPWYYFLLPAVGVAVYVALRDTGTHRLSEVGLLVWWAGSILAFFVLTGNHEWYIIPMYVPAAILVGWLFTDALDGTRAARFGLGIGLPYALLFSFRSPSPIATHDPPVMWGHFLRSTPFLIVLVSGVAFVLLYPRFRRATRRDLGSHGDFVRTAVPTCVALILLVSFSTPFAYSGGYHSQHAELGHVANQNVPPEEPIFIHERVTRGMAFFTFSFYAERPLEKTNTEDIASNPNIEYAVVPTNLTVQRSHHVVKQYDKSPLNPVKLIRFTAETSA